jgi:Sulfotransferase family
MFRRNREDSRRHVILHYHFFKNAGTTIESVLKRNFRAGFALFDSDDHNSAIRNDALLEFLAGHAEVTAVSSHHLRPPKPVDNRFIFHDLLFLRHPIARLWSTYEFYRRSDLERDPLAAAAKTRTPREFFVLLAEDYPYHASNAQLNLLVNAGGKTPTESDLLAAVEVIRQATVLGVAELFDESAISAESSLRQTFGGFDFSYFPQNVSGLHPTSLEAQFARFQKNCGTEVFERILESNRLDVALTEISTKEVLRRFHLVPDYESRLRNFRDRCRAWEGPSARIIIASNHPNGFALYANPLDRTDS